jgi:hypothetical protein
VASPLNFWALRVRRNFHKDDQKNIIGQLAKFDTTQKTATIHIETFPKGQAFAFKE